MLDMRPSINNALTSVLGNADLAAGAGASHRRQPGTNPNRSTRWRLRLNEIMQRFSSLDCEMRAGEKESHAETEPSVS